MLDAENPNESTEPTTGPEGGNPPETASVEEAAPAKKTAAKRTTKKAATAKKIATKKTAAKRTTKRAATAQPESAAAESAAAEPAAESAGPGGGTTDVAGEASGETPTGAEDAAPAPVKRTARKTTKKTAAKRTTKKTAAAPAEEPAATGAPAETPVEGTTGETVTPAEPASTAEPLAGSASAEEAAAPSKATPPSVAVPLFQPPDPSKAVVTTRKRTSKKAAAAEPQAEETSEAEAKPAKKAAARHTSKRAAGAPVEESAAEEAEEPTSEQAQEEREDEQGGERRRRRRGGRRRRRSGGGDESESESTEFEQRGEQAAESDEAKSVEEGEGAAGSRRRRRRRRSGEGDGDEGETTSSRARKPRNAEDEITALSGSTRLEAKKQRRREGREAGRRRAPIVSEAEFLARRESVDRVMVIRQRKDLTQIAVLEDKVLVEHYVARESQTSLIGNVYLGRVQNVLPSMEAAFVDIGKGRNAVLYAGEVNWQALGAKNGQPRKIEQVLKSGQPILVQVTKDPVGHKGARLTSQVSLPGRFLVYVPDGTTSGISRKLPDTERNRLKSLLKEIVPESAGVIVRTAAEGASEDELTRDVERLTARWSDIEAKVKTGNAPQLLYGEPDLTLKVVRDLFTEDFKKLVVAGDDAWDMVEGYVDHVAPDLADRLEKYDGERDVFAEYRIDEQIEKALDRKVWLPSGGSLVIDRTEAMTVVDVNTGKFTGSGGNLEETVTKNNLEAAEEIVRQLRLRDIGGIIVVDFIDMVLESNRDLVLRRLVECLGRDRTRHQVAEVTSLGLVQMTRKRIGTGLLEAFSEICEHCQGRGLILHHEPVEPKKQGDDDGRRGRRSGRGRGREESGGAAVPSPKDVAAMARPEEAASDEKPEAHDDDKGKGDRKVDRNGDRAAAGERTGAEVAARPDDTGQEPAGAGDTEQSAAPETQPAEQGAADGGESGEGRPSRPRGARGRGRGRGRSTTPSDQAGEEPQSEQTPNQQPAAASAPRQSEAGQEPATEAPAAEAPAEAAAPAAPDAPAEPAAPKVVTTVRRRARRAAGPPTSEAAGTGARPTTGQEPASPGGSATETSIGASAEADVDEPGDVDAIAALVEDAEVEQEAAEASPDGADGAEVGASTTPHVPVKKRGARRR